jgi:hypothetical protein
MNERKLLRVTEPPQEFNSAESDHARQLGAEWNIAGAVFGDPLQKWVKTIRDLKWLVELWESFRADDRAAIRRKLRYRSKRDHRFVDQLDENGATAATFDFNRDTFFPRDLREAANFFL